MRRPQGWGVRGGVRIAAKVTLQTSSRDLACCSHSHRQGSEWLILMTNIYYMLTKC